MARQYTRETIRGEFIQMLNEQPLEKIMVKDIVARSQISRNTFYYYYADLYAILAEIFQTELDRVIHEFQETQSWEEGFITAARFALNNKRAVYHVYNSIQKEELERYLFGVAGEVMTRYVDRISAAHPAGEEDKRLIAAFYQSALTEMVMRWVGSGMKEDPERMIRRIGQLFDGNIALSLDRGARLHNEW